MPQSLNRFAYVYNNPLRYIDPTGNKGEHGIQSSWWGATLNAAADVADFFTVSGEEVENSTGVERFVNEVGYRTQNLVSFGAWSRQEQIAGAYFERGEISGASFVGGTLLNAAASGGQAAVAISTLGAGSLAAAVGSNAAIAVADKFAWETFENQAALRDGYSSLGDYAVTGAVAGALGGAGYGLGRLAASPLGRMSVREAGKAVPAFLREAKRELRTVASGLMSDAGAFGRGFGRGWRGFEAPARGARLLDVTSVPGVVAEEVATRARQAAAATREGIREVRNIANASGVADAIERPVLELSRAEFPNHTTMLDNAVAKGHSLEGLKRGPGRRAAERNRYLSQKDIRKSQGGPPRDYDYDEFPYASTEQGGTGAHVEPVLSKENQAAGRRLGAFYHDKRIGSGDLFDITIID
jgi:hypothetical protein